MKQLMDCNSQGNAIGSSKPNTWPRRGIWAGAEHGSKHSDCKPFIHHSQASALVTLGISSVAVSNAGEGNWRLGVGTGLLSEHISYLPSMLKLQSHLVYHKRSLSSLPVPALLHWQYHFVTCHPTHRFTCLWSSWLSFALLLLASFRFICHLL